MTRGPGSPARHIMIRTSVGSLEKSAKAAMVSFSIAGFVVVWSRITGVIFCNFGASQAPLDVSLASACICGKSVED